MSNDPMYQLDLERTANEPVSEGVHIFKIVDFEEGESDKGPWWKFVCQPLTAGEENKTVWLYLSHTIQARWKMELFLDAVGAPEKGKVTADRFLGKMFRGQIYHEVYNERTQARIGEMSSYKPDAAPSPALAGKPATAPAKTASKAAPKPAGQAPKPAAKGLPADIVPESAGNDTSGF